MLFKNVASQKIHVYAYDSTTGAPKTGDAANITAYVSLDGTANAIDDTNPAEVDATNMPGVYVFDLTQAETNCNSFALYAKSATENIRIEPIIGFTTGAAATQTGDVYAALPTNFSDLVIEPATQWADIVVSASGTAMTITSATGGFTEDMVGRYLYLEHADAVGVAIITEHTDTNGVEAANLWPTLLGEGDLTGVRGVLGGRVLASESAHRPVDAAVATSNNLLSARLVGTIAAGTHNAQSGNCYPVVSSGTYGNNALKTLIDAIGAKTTNLPTSPAATGDAMTLTEGQSTALVAAIEAEIADDATGEAIKQAIIDKLIENLPDLDDLTLAAIGTACRDAVLNRVLAGNHNVAGSLGLLAQKLAVAGTLANTDNADSFKADVSGVPAATKLAMEAEGGHLTLILEDTAAIPTANDVADALLGRDASEVEDTAPEHSLCTVILAMLQSSVSGTTWTIKRTNGETTHATKTITTDADAEPITGVS